MKVRLTWVEKNFRGEELSKREEVLHGESAKEPTRHYVGRLIARHHPELVTVASVHLTDSSEEGYRWYVKSIKLDSNRWVTVYADPFEDLRDEIGV